MSSISLKSKQCEIGLGQDSREYVKVRADTQPMDDQQDECQSLSTLADSQLGQKLSNKL